MNIVEKAKKTGWFRILLCVYLFLFLFTMVNREFLFFGLDLRFIELPLGVLILVCNCFLRGCRWNRKKSDIVGKALIAFYVFALISNIAWLWNGLVISEKQFLNEVVLVVNVFVGILVFYLNRDKVSYKAINCFTIFACLILALSMILVHQGYSLGEISGAKDVAYVYNSSIQVDNNNFYGEGFRIAGYASDPNYATMLLLIGIVCTIRFVKRTWLKSILITAFILSVGLSFSRTIVLASVPCLLYVLFVRKIQMRGKTKLLINNGILVSILVVSFTVPFLGGILDTLPATLTQRFIMWRKAGELFVNSPIVGNGLTSFRSFFTMDGYWYVQAHSTYWQIISEMGVIGMFLYYRIAIRALNMSINRPINYFLVLVFIIWIATCESIALPMSVFVYYLFLFGPPNEESKLKERNRALFFVNSLRRGGAEKVCINMINELVSREKDVDVVLADGKTGNDLVDKNSVNVIDLGIRGGKISRLVFSLFSVHRINRLFYEHSDEYELVTSHLPMSNFLTRLSFFSDESIYVFHIAPSFYHFINDILYKNLLWVAFKKKKIVTVSRGLEQEYLKKYNGSKKYTRTIYNPVVLGKCDKNDNVFPMEGEKYLLYVGRLEKQKRPDRMLEIFHTGNFYKKYKLVFCGTGAERGELERVAERNNIKDRIFFAGYQSDIYKWMANAEIMVSTSDREAFPMNLVEAFAVGTKVVAADCEFGPREILLDSYSSYLVSPIGDIGQYIKKIKAALKDYPRERNRILDLCNPECVIDQYISFYKEEIYG